MDWIVWTIEGIGVIIFVIWLIVPIREFGEIYKRLKRGAGSSGGDKK